MPQDEIQQIKESLDKHLAHYTKTIALMQKQIDVLKEHSHKHNEVDELDGLWLDGITYPYNPDYEPEKESDKNCKHEWESTPNACFSWCKNCGINVADIGNVDKPSEFISIRRDVAARWIEYQHADDVKTKITRWDASTNLAKEIKKGLI